MNKLYRFSPISNKDNLLEVVNYIANKNIELCNNVLGKKLQIDTLTIFTHYLDEFEKLKEVALMMGKLESESNGPYIKLNEPIEVSGNKIDLLRIRKPDPYRMQVGCNDFLVSNYEEFKNQFLAQKHRNLRLIKRDEYEMIEFFDPDYDTLAYIVSN